MKRPLTLALTVLLAAGLTACAAEAPSAPDGGPPPSGGGTSAAAGQQRPLPPLQQFEYEIYGLDASVEEREQREFDISVQVEDLIAECMKAEGFDYTPEPSRPELSEPGLTADGVSDDDLDDRAWVTRYGYGVVETPDRALGETLGSGMRKTAGEDGPNERYVATLSSSEEAAYRLALDGPEQTEENFSLADAGCRGQSRATVEGEDPSDLAEHEPLLEAMAEFWSGADAWDGLPQLDADWAACMEGRGHGGYARQGDALDDIAARYGVLWEAANPENGTGMTVEQTPPATDALQALAAEERELATVDLDCREEVDHRARYDAIVFAEETRFMEDHRPALDALKAAYELRGQR